MSDQSASVAVIRRSVEQAAPVIAHVIYRLQIGGMENGVVNLINQLPRDLYRHALVCITDSTDFAQRLQRDDVAIHSLHKRPGKDPRFYLRFWRLMRKLRPAIVHTRNLGALDLAALAALAGAPVRIHGEHGWDASDTKGGNRRHRRLRKFCDPAITRYVAVSRDIEHWLRTDIGISGDKVQQICNGVDVDVFRPDGPAAELFPRQRNGQELTIGSVGRMDPIKCFDVLVDAVAEVVRDGLLRGRSIRLVIVGEGPMYSGLSARIRDAGLEDLAILTGSRKDIPDVLRSLDVFVLPSENEGISNTVLEAMATGLPVIATNVGGNAELIDNDNTGYLVPSNSVGELAATIRRYVDDDDLRRNHGSAARRRAQECFSLDTMVAGYRQLYDRYLHNQN